MTRHANRFLPLLAAMALTALVGTAAAQDGLEPRLAGSKAPLSELRAMAHSNRVVIKFREGLRLRLRGGSLEGLTAADRAQLAAVFGASRVAMAGLRRMHARSEDDLDRERASAEREGNRRLADLNLYFVVTLPRGADAAAFADRLNHLSVVEFAEPAPVAAPPPFDISPTTPSFKSNQDYLNAAPQGVGALKPSRYQGAFGQGMDYADIEYSWQLNHEDLEIAQSRILTGGATLSDPFNDTNHGTAVLGEISGKSNGYGVTGLAPDARAYVAPANTAQFFYDPARAISLATAQLGKGDVMVIEQQYPACGLSDYGPLEWLQSVYDAIATATAKGIIVVEAAGNGAINLDSASCNNKFNRNVRDSRAIIVGAGNSTTHARLGFSSYGSRVDVQGWGELVATTGYGDAFNPGDVRQLYTFFFSGTSSATPIVSGAILQINGVIKACGVAFPSPKALRQLLVDNGTAQANPATGHIGPLPNIKKTLLASKAEACVKAQ